MSRTIALTGATGFIGGALLQRLEASGWHVRALRRPTSSRRRLSGSATHWIEGDLDNLESLRCLVRGAHAVVHCAGTIRGAQQVDFVRVNADGVARLVQAAREQHPVPRFLLMSSLAAREPNLSPYADSKRQGEEELASASGDMSWDVLRPPAVYGPGDRELLPLFRWMGRGLALMLGCKSARFSLLYVEDLAQAVQGWLDRGASEQCTFELHDGKIEGYSWHEVVDTVARFYGRKVFRLSVPAFILNLLASINLITARMIGYQPMLTPWKVRELRHSNWVCDNGLLSRTTGWTPRVSLEEGLRRTLKGPNRC